MVQQGNVGQDAGLIFNIQKFSVHDGPGIRTLIFLKGCPLRCQWCANPEGMHNYPELFYNRNKCIGTHECRYCLAACGAGAIKEVDGKAAINRALCTNCGDCAEACPAKALEVMGKYMTVDEILNVVEEDEVFYARSGGGITLSGGEPLQQAEFITALLKEARARGIDTSVETTGFTQWENIEKAFRYVNNIIYDIKCLDSEKHKKFTGVPNEIILDNFKRIVREFTAATIQVRTPVIPGFNDTKEDIQAIVNFIRETSDRVQYEILPYHQFGEMKYSYLGKTYQMAGVEKTEKGILEELEKVAKF